MEKYVNEIKDDDSNAVPNEEMTDEQRFEEALKIKENKKKARVEARKAKKQIEKKMLRSSEFTNSNRS